MSKYDGMKVDRSIVDAKYPSATTSRARLTPDMVRYIESFGARFELPDFWRAKLEEKLLPHGNNPGAERKSSPMLILIIFFGMMGLAFLFTAYTMYGFRGMLVPAILVVFFIATFSVIIVLSSKIGKKTSADIINAINSGRYAAFCLAITQKMWSYYSLLFTYDFYVDCGGMVLRVDRTEYENISDRMYVLLLYLDGKVSMLGMTPVNGGNGLYILDSVHIKTGDAP